MYGPAGSVSYLVDVASGTLGIEGVNYAGSGGTFAPVGGMATGALTPTGATTVCGVP